LIYTTYLLLDLNLLLYLNLRLKLDLSLNQKWILALFGQVV
jgi:hypothetical protein